MAGVPPTSGTNCPPHIPPQPQPPTLTAQQQQQQQQKQQQQQLQQLQQLHQNREPHFVPGGSRNLPPSYPNPTYASVHAPLPPFIPNHASHHQQLLAIRHQQQQQQQQQHLHNNFDHLLAFPSPQSNSNSGSGSHDPSQSFVGGVCEGYNPSLGHQQQQPQNHLQNSSSHNNSNVNYPVPNPSALSNQHLISHSINNSALSYQQQHPKNGTTSITTISSPTRKNLLIQNNINQTQSQSNMLYNNHAVSQVGLTNSRKYKQLDIIPSSQQQKQQPIISRSLVTPNTGISKNNLYQNQQQLPSVPIHPIRIPNLALSSRQQQKQQQLQPNQPKQPQVQQSQAQQSQPRRQLQQLLPLSTVPNQNNRPTVAKPISIPHHAQPVVRSPENAKPIIPGINRHNFSVSDMNAAVRMATQEVVSTPSQSEASALNVRSLQQQRLQSIQNVNAGVNNENSLGSRSVGNLSQVVNEAAKKNLTNNVQQKTAPGAVQNEQRSKPDGSPNLQQYYAQPSSIRNTQEKLRVPTGQDKKKQTQIDNGIAEVEYNVVAREKKNLTKNSIENAQVQYNKTQFHIQAVTKNPKAQQIANINTEYKNLQKITKEIRSSPPRQNTTVLQQKKKYNQSPYSSNDAIFHAQNAPEVPGGVGQERLSHIGDSVTQSQNLKQVQLSGQKQLDNSLVKQFLKAPPPSTTTNLGHLELQKPPPPIIPSPSKNGEEQSMEEKRKRIERENDSKADHFKKIQNEYAKVAMKTGDQKLGVDYESLTSKLQELKDGGSQLTVRHGYGRRRDTELITNPINNTNLNNSTNVVDTGVEKKDIVSQKESIHKKNQSSNVASKINQPSQVIAKSKTVKVVQKPLPGGATNTGRKFTRKKIVTQKTDGNNKLQQKSVNVKQTLQNPQSALVPKVVQPKSSVNVKLPVKGQRSGQTSKETGKVIKGTGQVKQVSSAQIQNQGNNEMVERKEQVPTSNNPGQNQVQVLSHGTIPGQDTHSAGNVRFQHQVNSNANTKVHTIGQLQQHHVLPNTQGQNMQFQTPLVREKLQMAVQQPRQLQHEASVQAEGHKYSQPQVNGQRQAQGLLEGVASAQNRIIQELRPRSNHEQIVEGSNRPQTRFPPNSHFQTQGQLANSFPAPQQCIPSLPPLQIGNQVGRQGSIVGEQAKEIQNHARNVQQQQKELQNQNILNNHQLPRVSTNANGHQITTPPLALPLTHNLPKTASSTQRNVGLNDARTTQVHSLQGLQTTTPLPLSIPIAPRVSSSQTVQLSDGAVLKEMGNMLQKSAQTNQHPTIQVPLTQEIERKNSNHASKNPFVRPQKQPGATATSIQKHIQQLQNQGQLNSNMANGYTVEVKGSKKRDAATANINADPGSTESDMVEAKRQKKKASSAMVQRPPPPPELPTIIPLTDPPTTNTATVGGNAPASTQAVGKNGPIRRQKQASWYDTIRSIWPILERENEGRIRFTINEIQSAIEAHWKEVRVEDPPKNNRWRTSLKKCVNTGFMLTKYNKNGNNEKVNNNINNSHGGKPKVDGSNGEDEYVMHNINFDRTAGGRVAKKSDGTSGEVIEELLLDDDALRRAVPKELMNLWTKPVVLSDYDKGKMIKFDEKDRKIVEGYKGFRMIRASNGISEGDWYFECEVLTYKGDGAVRLGWCTRRSDLETPVGFDVYGFGLRDRSGEFIHKGRRMKYGESFKSGDIIGCRIVLPTLSEVERKDISASERRFLEYRYIRFAQGPHPPDSDVNIVDKAHVEFFKNGVSMGIPQFFQTTGDYVRLNESVEGVTTETLLREIGGDEPIKNDQVSEAGGSGSSTSCTGMNGNLHLMNNVSNNNNNKENRQTLKSNENHKVNGNTNHKNDNSNDGDDDPSKVEDDGGRTINERELKVLKRVMMAGIYYPSVSLFGKARVKVNFGPDFHHPLPKSSRAMYEAAPDSLPSGVAGRTYASAIYMAGGPPHSSPSKKKRIVKNGHAKESKINNKEVPKINLDDDDGDDEDSVLFIPPPGSNNNVEPTERNSNSQQEHDTHTSTTQLPLVPLQGVLDRPPSQVNQLIAPAAAIASATAAAAAQQQLQ